MTSRAEAEAAIRRLMATETDPVRFSNWLFAPPPFGLFGKLWSTQDEKKAVIASPLFQEANRRLSELQWQELARTEAPSVVPASPPPSRADEPGPAEAKP